jgi:hypothetical protein
MRRWGGVKVGHYDGVGVVSILRQIAERPAVHVIEATPPQRTICAWHARYFSVFHGPHVLVDVPADDRGISHGMCDACARVWLARQGE